MDYSKHDGLDLFPLATRCTCQTLKCSLIRYFSCSRCFVSAGKSTLWNVAKNMKTFVKRIRLEAKFNHTIFWIFSSRPIKRDVKLFSCCELFVYLIILKYLGIRCPFFHQWIVINDFFPNIVKVFVQLIFMFFLLILINVHWRRKQ